MASLSSSTSGIISSILNSKNPSDINDNEAAMPKRILALIVLIASETVRRHEEAIRSANPADCGRSDR